jgi:hypothetical protein
MDKKQNELFPCKACGATPKQLLFGEGYLLIVCANHKCNADSFYIGLDTNITRRHWNHNYGSTP